jgi:putative ABC transport system permease protein
MAWRDSRTSRKRILLFMSSVLLGVAALVAISSFRQSLQESIEDQAKSLLGADLVIRSRQPFTQEVLGFLNSIGGDQSREISFTSMVSFPKSGGTRLAQIKAMEGHFPYYGTLETVPVDAASTFKTGPNALVEDALLRQFDAQVGDSIKVGSFTFNIAGRLKKAAGATVASVLIGSRVYIPMDYLAQTKLLQRGSLASYKVSFRLDHKVDVEQLVHRLEPQLTKYRLESETVQERKSDLGHAVEDGYQFLSLVGFIALLLGSIGVASAVYVYIRQRMSTVAVLRCLGARAGEAFAVYLVQAIAIGLLGAVSGAIVGVGTQILLPKLLVHFLPLSMPFTISWSAILQGIFIGLVFILLFALLPLLAVRKISPLLTLRSSYEDPQSGTKDPLRWLIYLSIAGSICAFAISHNQRWTHGLAFAVAIGVSFGLLVGVAKLIIVLAKKNFPSSWPYVWRQGLANLFRPNNQTVVVMLSLGLGTFLVLTLYLVHNLLLEKLTLSSRGHQSNMILFDIQSDQKQNVVDLLRSFNAPVLQQAPIVTMRLEAVKGRSVQEILNDPNRSIPEWFLQREYRSTYRESLTDTEKVIGGTWQGRVSPGSTSVPISVEEGVAKNLKVTVGDELIFDVQGIPVTTTVGSIRKVEWERVVPNFFVVFPVGILESAPQFYVLATRVDGNEVSAKLQQALVQQFPNVSAIDLALILSTIDGILSKVSFVIRFIALFSVATGLTILAGAVVTGRYQRIQESILLRTLGASRAQITKIMLVEYLFLGSFAALTGIILAWLSTWTLSYFIFDIVFMPKLLPNLIALIAVVGLTLLTGMLNSRGIYDRPPLEVLRAEA